MGTYEEESLNLQRQRRKRINRMKKGILLFIAIWFITSFIVIVVLSVSLVKMSKRVKELEANKNTVEYNVSQQSETVALSEDTQSIEEGTKQKENGIDSLDNMAGSNDEHKVYLTFDSVPGDNTNEILDILLEYQVKATFFVSGNASDNSAIYKRIVDEGHTIGMHSYSNQYNVVYHSTDSFLQDLEQAQSEIANAVGETCSYYRFPGGSGNQISNVNMKNLVKLLKQKQITYYDWNVSGGDTAVSYTAEDVISNVTEQIPKYKTSIVLLQDDQTKHTTVEALAPLIEKLQEMQVEILPIDDNTKRIQYINEDDVE